MIRYGMIYDMILILILVLVYLLTAVWLPPGGSSTVHIYTQTVHRTTQDKNIENRTYITIRMSKHNKRILNITVRKHNIIRIHNLQN